MVVVLDADFEGDSGIRRASSSGSSDGPGIDEAEGRAAEVDRMTLDRR